jgi:hypothetical protein
LYRLVQAAGQDGINKLIANFLANHPGISKRQAEIKINEVAVKEKREHDKYIIWHVLDDSPRLFKLPVGAAVAAGAVWSRSALAATANSGKKRKKEDAAAMEDGAQSADAMDVVPPGFEGKEPKRYKRAFGFFVKAKRAEAEAQLGASAAVRCVFVCAWACVRALVVALRRTQWRLSRKWFGLTSFHYAPVIFSVLCADSRVLRPVFR